MWYTATCWREELENHRQHYVLLQLCFSEEFAVLMFDQILYVSQSFSKPFSSSEPVIVEMS